MKLIRSVIWHQLSDVVLYGISGDRDLQIQRLLVGSAARADIAMRRGDECPDSEELAGIGLLIGAYLDGVRTDFSAVRLASTGRTPFADAVCRAARAIPYGSTCSYSELAERAGNPRAVRAAASVMRNNPWPLIVPCHRVIGKDGKAGAYNGDRSGDDAALKVRLLRMEAGVLGRNPG